MREKKNEKIERLTPAFNLLHENGFYVSTLAKGEKVARRKGTPPPSTLGGLAVFVTVFFLTAFEFPFGIGKNGSSSNQSCAGGGG